MILIVGTIRIAPERLAEAKPAMQKVITASRKELGCLEYAYAEDILDPGLIHIAEHWESQEAFDEHFASDHIAEWCGAWKNLGIFDRKLSIHEVSEPQAIPLRTKSGSLEPERSPAS
jgi:quinol monooxygenase YgiN